MHGMGRVHARARRVHGWGGTRPCTWVDTVTVRVGRGHPKPGSPRTASGPPSCAACTCSWGVTVLDRASSSSSSRTCTCRRTNVLVLEREIVDRSSREIVERDRREVSERDRREIVDRSSRGRRERSSRGQRERYRREIVGRSSTDRREVVDRSSRGRRQIVEIVGREAVASVRVPEDRTVVDPPAHSGRRR